jgi:hypothetical protein
VPKFLQPYSHLLDKGDERGKRRVRPDEAPSDHEEDDGNAVRSTAAAYGVGVCNSTCRCLALGRGGNCWSVWSRQGSTWADSRQNVDATFARDLPAAMDQDIWLPCRRVWRRRWRTIPN